MAVKKAGHVWGEKKKRIKKKERKTEDIEFIFFLIEVIV